ncbi:MAG TPA: CHAT domain-containing protein [Thermoanaerobaculia bacterium]|nr:CHAT domain-containing protein [Thermoanaerobaculia bacterium]
MLPAGEPFRAVRAGAATPRAGPAAWFSILGFLALSFAFPTGGTAATPPDPFAPCAEQVRAAPEKDGSYLCFYDAGSAEGRFAEADALLERLGRVERSGPGPIGAAWVRLVRGYIALDALGQDEDRALLLFREAAARFSRLAVPAGEVKARANLRNILSRRGETAAAAEETARALAAAERSKDPDLLAFALILEAHQLMEVGGDLGRAAKSLKRAEALVFPGGSPRRQQSCLEALAGLSFRLGRYEEAGGYYRRLASIHEAAKNPLGQATATYSLALTRQRQLEELPEPGGVEEVETLAEQALRLARAAGSREIEQRSLQLLGENERARGRPARAREVLEQSLALARELSQPERVANTLWSLAHLAEGTEAASIARQATAVAEEIGDPRSLAIAWQGRMRVDWRTLPRQAAVAHCLEALSAIESLRKLQPEEESRVGLFSAWTQNYRWLAGRLLEGKTPDLPSAFGVMERMRGRFLLESLAASGAAAPPLAPNKNRREVAALSGQAAQLDVVQRALAPDEALLLFQLGSWRDLYGDFAGGSWSIVLTRGGARVIRLPGRGEIETLLPVFLGLIERRDGKEAPAAARLGAMLLGPALRALPAEIHRLVIVPDGALYSLPWEALRARPESPPLGLRYEIALAPSATLFAHWRSRPRTLPARGALVLADPQRAVPATATRGATSPPPAAEAAFGPLPYARREGEEVARRLPGSELWTGERATRKELSRADLEPFAALHLAAHAIADAAHPDRSAVMLADGPLQPREIVALPLSGKLAVLSACQTADGTVISGEGTMSLARAFFQAGAATVIGSRWPLADDEAETISKSFYRALSAGNTAGRALAQARREAADAGLPPAAWAGLVLMGDPAFALPLALQRPPRSIPGWAFGWGGLLLGIGAALTLKIARSRRATRRARIG